MKTVSERREVLLRAADRLGSRRTGGVAKHGRPIVVMMAAEEYERLKVFEVGHVDSGPSTSGTAEY